jgi:hypothetical protein
MSIFPPLYTQAELQKLDEQKRNELRLAIVKVLQTDSQVREMLKDKTRAEYDQLAKKHD